MPMTIEFLVYDADFVSSALRLKATWLREDTAHDHEDVAKLQRAADRLDAHADKIDEQLAGLEGQPAAALTARLDAEVGGLPPGPGTIAEMAADIIAAGGTIPYPGIACASAIPAPQTVAIGPDDTAILVEALDRWLDDNPRSRVDLERIRAELTGRPLS